MNENNLEISRRDEFQDGYETGGAVYFWFDGKEMVAVLRTKAEYEQHYKAGTSLKDYNETLVSPTVYGAGLALEQLIPIRKRRTVVE